MKKLPPLPHHPEPHTYTWTKSELESIAEYGALCRKQALEEAAKFLESTDLAGLDSAKQQEYGKLLWAYAKHFRELMK